MKEKNKNKEQKRKSNTRRNNNNNNNNRTRRKKKRKDENGIEKKKKLVFFFNFSFRCLFLFFFFLFFLGFLVEPREPRGVHADLYSSFVFFSLSPPFRFTFNSENSVTEKQNKTQHRKSAERFSLDFFSFHRSNRSPNSVKLGKTR